jgi:hypothetical protein
MQRFASISIKSESLLIACNTSIKKLYIALVTEGHMTCPTWSSFGNLETAPDVAGYAAANGLV